MRDEVDDGELRELRAKAYGPDGELTDAEARRLQELQALVRGAATERAASTAATAVPAADRRNAAGERRGVPSPSGASRDDDAVHSAGVGRGGNADADVDMSGVRDPRHAAAATSDAGSEDALAGSDTDDAASTGLAGQDSRRGIRTRRWFPYAAVGLVLLIGFGIGFVVFGQSVMRSIALSLAVGAEQVQLEAEGDYDPGSITPLGQSHGATVWHATRGEGKNHCLVITLEDRVEPACVPGDQLNQPGGGLYASMDLPPDDDGGVSGLNVTVTRDIDGELAVVAQVWDSYDVWDWRAQYTEDELAIVDRIESETGVAGEFLQIVGYDGDRPVWQEFSSTRACVIVAVVGSVERACADEASAPAVLEIANPDGTSTRYHVTTSDTRGPTLTIERGSAPGADAAIDDRTGDVEP